MSSPSRILIAGAGYVGTALVKALVADGIEVYALRRRVDEADGALGTSPQWIRADVGDPSSLRDLPPDLDAVVYLVSSGGRSETAYRQAYVEGPGNLLRALGRAPRQPRFLFASSTAVYGDAGGAWVDEDTPTEPAGFTGRILLEGERLVLDSGPDSRVVRFSGIYGPGRTRLIDRVRSGEARCLGAADWTNRIHRDDCAGFLRHLLRASSEHRVFLASDDEPADRCDVYRWLARRLGAPEPQVEASEEVSDRRARNKRCRNARLRESGYRLLYPTYREGYAMMLDAEEARGTGEGSTTGTKRSPPPSD